MSSAQEAETVTAFINTREAVPICTILEELGHQQGPTPIQLNNKCAVGIINDTMQKNDRKQWMQFYWLKDRETQKRINVFWKKGSSNLADYPTKHRPVKHHQTGRPNYVLNAMTRLHAKIFACSKLL